MEKKKNVPKLRFPGFTNAWEKRKLEEIGQILTGNTPSTKDEKNWADKENGYIWITPTDIKSLFTEYSERYLSQKGWTLARKVPKNSVLITSIASIGKNTINIFPAAFNQQINAIIPKKNNEYFILFAMEKEKNRFSLLAGKSATSIINKTQFEKFILLVASLEEQTKIGNFFQSFDKLITLHQRKLENLKNQKKSLLQKMFPKNNEKFPELRFPNFTAAWEKRKLGDIGETYMGLLGKRKEDFGHGEGKYITYLNVFSNEIVNPNLLESIEIDSKQNTVQYGDILFTISSETPEEVGMSSVWVDQYKNIYLNSFCFGYRIHVNFHVYYFTYMLRSPEVRKKIKVLAQGISRYNISKNKVMEIETFLPKIEEQTKIGNFFQSFDKLITLHHRKLENLQELKKGLLQQMFV